MQIYVRVVHDGRVYAGCEAENESELPVQRSYGILRGSQQPAAIALMRLRILGLLGVVALTACTAKAAPVSTASFTPDQRAQIVAAMREAMKKDPSILRDAILVLQADNDRIQAQAQHDALSNHQDVLFDASDPSTGNQHGATTIVEFFDPRCPYCKQIAPSLARFVADDGNVRLVYKDLPILGPASEMGSRALLAAANQGRYEELRASIMRGASEDLTEASVRNEAQKLGLDWARMQRDMASPAIAKRLAANKQLASDLGIEGTPTLVIGQKIVEGADMPTIAAAVANARHDRSHDQSKAASPMSTAAAQ
jgi:protein-disulfide isomerase